MCGSCCYGRLHSRRGDWAWHLLLLQEQISWHPMRARVQSHCVIGCCLSFIQFDVIEA